MSRQLRTKVQFTGWRGLIFGTLLSLPFWILLFLLLTGCAANAPVIEGKLSYDVHKTMGRQPTATLRVRQYFGREPAIDRLRWFGEYEHDSSLRDGKPFNDRNDRHTIDSFGGGFAVPLWK